jgi:hypothetical protein
MKKCGLMLSDETREVLKEILIEIEHLRNKANEKNDFPPSDYPYRPCQAIIAERLGFESRIEWNNDNYLGIKVKL